MSYKKITNSYENICEDRISFDTSENCESSKFRKCIKDIREFPSYYKFLKKTIKPEVNIFIDERDKKIVVIKKLNDCYNAYDNLITLKNLKLCSEFFVCPIDIFRKENEFYFITEFLQDFTTLEKLTHLPINKKKQIIQNIWKSVNILHNNNIIHSDLQPRNIMVHPKTLKVRIIDFDNSLFIHHKNCRYYQNLFFLKYLNYTKEGMYTPNELKELELKYVLAVMYWFLFRSNELPKEDFLKTIPSSSEIKKILNLS